MGGSATTEPPSPPLPLWERAFGLSATGTPAYAGGPRRLGRKGEGPDLSRFVAGQSCFVGAGPSPFPPKLPPRTRGSLRREALSHKGRGGVRVSSILPISTA